MTIWNMEITASESPQTVHIPIEGKYYAIKNTGDHDILVSSYVVNPTEGADDVMKIPSGSAAVIPVKDGDLYVSAEEDGTYSVSIQDDKVIPWGGGTGSGGGGRTETVLWKNEGTTNPETITLSEAYTNFDEIVVYNGGGFYGISSNIYAQSVLSQGNAIGIIEDQNRRIWYRITSPTALIKADEETIVLNSIIGIKYGSGGGTLGALAYKDTASGSYTPAGSVSVAQSPATYVYDGTTGLTTYTEAGAPSATFTGTTENITVG